jgi:hypothetical protein
MVPGLAPPFDGVVGETRPCKVIGKCFRRGSRRGGEVITQNLTDAAMQDTPPAFEQIFICRVLN